MRTILPISPAPRIGSFEGVILARFLPSLGAFVSNGALKLASRRKSKGVCIEYHLICAYGPYSKSQGGPHSSARKSRDSLIPMWIGLESPQISVSKSQNFLTPTHPRGTLFLRNEIYRYPSGHNAHGARVPRKCRPVISKCRNFETSDTSIWADLPYKGLWRHPRK